MVGTNARKALVRDVIAGIRAAGARFQWLAIQLWSEPRPNRSKKAPFVCYEEAASGFPLMLPRLYWRSPWGGVWRCATVSYPGAFWTTWGPALTAKQPEITMQTADQFVTRMFETNPDFVFTVTRDFVRSCQNPILVLPDDVPAHPYAVAMECAMLAPKAEVSIFPWKEPKERIPLAVRQIHSFLKAHQPP
jgi:hypothetical protein